MLPSGSLRADANHPKFMPIAFARPIIADVRRRLSVAYFLIGDAQLKTNPAFGLGTSLVAISARSCERPFPRASSAILWRPLADMPAPVAGTSLRPGL